MDEPYLAGPDTYALPSHIPVPGVGNLLVNAFVLRSEEPVLIDTGLGTDSPEFLDAVDSIVPLSQLKWIWLTHDDADHTGSIQKVLERAPQAKLATHGMAALRMGSWFPVPLDRVHALQFDDSLHVGDRTLRALRPPTFDNPMSIGLFDESNGTLFSVDSFGALLPEVTQNAFDIPMDDLTRGMVAWGTFDAPWMHVVDLDRFEAVLDGVRRLEPARVLSSHLPAAEGNLEHFLEVLRSLRDADPAVPPDHEAFAQLAALIQNPSEAPAAT